MAWARHGHCMASVNQTRPHCVNQMGKTYSKPLVARHGRGTAYHVWLGLYCACRHSVAVVLSGAGILFEFPCIISLYYIKNQQDATLAVFFTSNCKNSTCFGSFLRPSSGVLKTVVSATGACHRSGWYISSKDVQGRQPTLDVLTGYILPRPMTCTSGCYYSF